MQDNSTLNNFWSLKKEDALAALSCTDKGLSQSAATARLKQYGPNSFKADPKSTSIKLFLSQFKSPITLLLIGPALLSMFLGNFSDAIIILIIILISSALGFW